jgi:hypothetical protein
MKSKQALVLGLPLIASCLFLAVRRGTSPKRVDCDEFWDGKPAPLVTEREIASSCN